MRFAYGRPRLPTGFDLYSLLTPSVLPLNAEVKWAMDDPEAMPEVKPLYSLKGKRVWVAGHRGMVGSALLRRLEQEDCTLLTVEREEVDLTRQEQVERWMGNDASASGLSSPPLKSGASSRMTVLLCRSFMTISPSR